MSDEYQLRKDVDGIYRKFYDYQRQQWNVITSDDLQEALDNLPTGGDNAIDVMNKIGMAYFLRNQTVYDVTGTVTNYWQEVMQYGLSAVLLDHIVNEEGVYEVRKNQSGMQTTDLFYYYDGDSKLTLLTPMKVDWSISNYNPNIDSTVTVRARIMDMFDNAISYENVTLNYEAGGVGGSVNLISDSDGYVSYEYTCSSWGQCRFSIKTYDTFINIANPYPVGSIYMSVNSTNPSTLFGGTWEQLKDRFLLGSGDTYNNGATGGSATVKLTANQSGLRSHGHGMKHTHSHHHSLTKFSSGQGSKEGYTQSSNRSLKSRDTTTDATASSKSTTDSNTALDAKEAHNNLPPYLVVYMWKRIA